MKKLILAFICMIFLVGTVSAWDLGIDNYKKYEKADLRYGKIEVWDTGQIGDDKILAEYTLTENTDQCLIDCYSEGTATLHTSGEIFSDLNFKNRVGSNVNIKESKLLLLETETYDAEVTDYKEVCNEFLGEEECYNIPTGTHKEERTIELWKEYNYKNLEPGTYQWRIEGKKDKAENIDWVVESFGEDFTEWAWWDSDNWKRKKEVNISGGTELLSNFPVLVNVSFESFMQPDFDDIRFINGSCGGTQTLELKYELDNKVDSQEAQFWVLVPALLPGGFTNQICVNYNNSAATSTSDGVAVWNFETGAGAHAVYHFEEGTGEDVFSSTGLVNLTTNETGNIVWDSVSEGMIGGGIEIIKPNQFLMNATASDGLYINNTHDNGYTIVSRFMLFNETIAFQSLFSGGGQTTPFFTSPGRKIPTAGVGPPSIVVGAGQDCSGCDPIQNGSVPTTVIYMVNKTDTFFLVNMTADPTHKKGGAPSNINISDGFMYIGTSDSFGAPLVGNISELQIYNEQKNMSWRSRMSQNFNYSNLLYGPVEELAAIALIQSAPLNLFNNTENSTIVFECNTSTVGGLEVANVIVNVWNEIGPTFESSISSILIGGGPNSTILTLDLPPQQNYSWFCFANDTNGLNSVWTGNRSVFVYPDVLNANTILNTIDNLDTLNLTNTFSANSTSDNGDLVNVTYFLWNGSFFLVDSITTTVSGTDATDLTNQSLTALTPGDYAWNALTCAENATSSICRIALSNRSMTINTFDAGPIFFNSSALETSEQFFQFNITTISNLLSLSANLNYNGTIFPSEDTCDGTSCRIENTIDIPLVDGTVSNQNKSFFWEVILFAEDSTTAIAVNSSALGQNVTYINFEQCNATNIGPAAVNYLIFDETNLTKKVNATFQSTFTYYLGNGSVTKSNFTTASNPTVNDTYSFCIDQNDTYHVNAEIDLEGSGNDIAYIQRRYDFLKEDYSNDTTNQNLYLLNTTEGTTITIDVKDQGLQIVDGFLVKILRFYPEVGEFRFIASQLTDSLGQFAEKFIQDDVKYKFEFYDAEKILRKTSDDIRIICRSSFCLIPFVIEESSTDFEEFIPLLDYSVLLDFNNNTNIFTLSWDDKRNEIAKHRLEVEKFLFNGTSIVCNETSFSNIGVINCGVGSSRATYTAQAFRTPGIGDNAGNERRVYLLTIKIGDPSSIFGLEGLIWIFLILFTMVGIGSFSPQIGAILYLVGLTMFGLTGIISFSASMWIANLVIVIIFIWAFRG